MELLINLPFAGFYESVHNDRIDREVEQLVEDDSGRVYDDLAEDFYFHYGYTDQLLQDYGRLYLEAYTSAIEEEAGFTLGLKFDGIESPRFYNFTTDRLFAKIPEAAVLRIYAETDREELAKKVEERHSSYSGFVSFYSNNLEDWEEDVLAWDCNQLCTLFLAWIESRGIEVPDEIYLLQGAYCNGDLSNLIWDHLPEKCKEATDKASERRERGIAA